MTGKYKAKEYFSENIALFCSRIRLNHMETTKVFFKANGTMKEDEL